MARKHWKLTVYDLRTEYAKTVKQVSLYLTERDARKALAAVRVGLPKHCGAGLSPA